MSSKTTDSSTCTFDFFSKFDSAAHALAVYASHRQLPVLAQDSLSDGGLTYSDRDFNPTGYFISGIWGLSVRPPVRVVVRGAALHGNPRASVGLHREEVSE